MGDQPYRPTGAQATLGQRSRQNYAVLKGRIGVVPGLHPLFGVQGDDPGYKAMPEAFAPLIVRGAPPADEPAPKAEAEKPVERATAEPGEKRETAPPAGKAMTNDQLKGRSH